MNDEMGSQSSISSVPDASNKEIGDADSKSITTRTSTGSLGARKRSISFNDNPTARMRYLHPDFDGFEDWSQKLGKRGAIYEDPHESQGKSAPFLRKGKKCPSLGGESTGGPIQLGYTPSADNADARHGDEGDRRPEGGDGTAASVSGSSSRST